MTHDFLNKFLSAEEKKSPRLERPAVGERKGEFRFFYIMQNWHGICINELRSLFKLNIK